jgi:hypothetical protein
MINKQLLLIQMKQQYQATEEILFLRRRLQPKAAAAPIRGNGPGTP